MLTCAGCGAFMSRKPVGPPPKWCSRSCKEAAYRAGDRYKALLASKRAARVPSRLEVECEGCRAQFTAQRKDTRFCSERCRERARPERCSNHPDRPVRAKGLCFTCYKTARYASGEATKYALEVCPTCSTTFAPTRRPQTYCSLLCRSGGSFKRAYTEAERAKSRERRRHRRALKRGVDAESFTDVEIYERDGWRCGVCRRKVNPRNKWPHPMSPSLDHVIPVTEVGTSHTRANVRLAHLRCNILRSNHGGNEQLLLFG